MIILNCYLIGLTYKRYVKTFVIIILCIWFISPILYISIQKYKRVMRGNWNYAVIPPKDINYNIIPPQ